MTIEEFAADWPYSHARPTAETNRHYRQMVRRFVDRFGERPLESITHSDVQTWAMENVSALRYVRAFFADALLDGVIVANPAARVKVPHAPRRRRDEHVPTEFDIAHMIGRADFQLGAAIALGAYVGLREAEIRGVQWSSLHDDTAYIYRQASRGRPVTFKPLKGKVKERHVDVFRKARAQLDAWAAIAPEGELIVPLTYNELYERWRELRDECGLACEFHQLRTFCASWMLEKGASPIDVAVQLHGHTDPTVVLSYYAMIDKGKALERLRRVVDGD